MTTLWDNGLQRTTSADGTSGCKPQWHQLLSDSCAPLRTCAEVRQTPHPLRMARESREPPRPPLGLHAGPPGRRQLPAQEQPGAGGGEGALLPVLGLAPSLRRVA